MAESSLPAYHHPGGESSDKCWETPQVLFDVLDAHFRFDLDVCATPETAKCESYYTPEDDGLEQSWESRTCWLNPPYGKTLGRWMQKADEASKEGATVVCLVPVRSDVAWWHDYALRHEVVFLRGRLYFRQDGERKGAAAFPCALVVIRPVPVPVCRSWAPTKEQRG